MKGHALHFTEAIASIASSLSLPENVPNVDYDIF